MIRSILLRTITILFALWLSHADNVFVLNADDFHSNEVSSYAAVNPDVYLDTPQIIARHGYPAETHTVRTPDGYLLKVHRIPATGPNSQPIFLQHGLSSSSADWVDTDNASLGFILADLGYDVWLGNARGNPYSNAHVTLSSHSSQFWNFSWHEMGMNDVPAVIKHIAKVTKQAGNIIYVGHSMGTTMFYVWASQNPNEAKQYIKAMVSLAPVAFMGNIRSPIRLLSPFVNQIEWLSEHLGINEFKPSSVLRRILSYECRHSHTAEEICENVIFMFCGYDAADFNEAALPVILSHSPSSASSKTLIHYAQENHNYGYFRMFDYGAEGNVHRYGNVQPPEYNLSAIDVPIYLMYAENDYLAAVEDVKKLASLLPNKLGVYDVPNKQFNHLDFLFAMDAPEIVYKQLVKVIRDMSH